MNLRLQWDVEKDLLKEFLRRVKPFLCQSFQVDDDDFEKMVASIDELPDAVTFGVTGEHGLENLLSLSFFAGAPRLFIEVQKKLVEFEDNGGSPFGDRFKSLVFEVVADTLANMLANAISSRRVFARKRTLDEDGGGRDPATGEGF